MKNGIVTRFVRGGATGMAMALSLMVAAGQEPPNAAGAPGAAVPASAQLVLVPEQRRSKHSLTATTVRSSDPRRSCKKDHPRPCSSDRPNLLALTTSSLKK